MMKTSFISVLIVVCLVAAVDMAPVETTYTSTRPAKAYASTTANSGPAPNHSEYYDGFNFGFGFGKEEE